MPEHATLRAVNEHPATRSIASGQVHILTGSAAPVRAARQYAKIGTAPGLNHRVVGIDLAAPNTILLFGVQGSGKSYTKQLIMESCAVPIPGINALPAPPCVIDFHYTPDLGMRPEALALGLPNDHPDQTQTLRSLWRAEPTSLTDIIQLVPRRLVAERRAEGVPGVAVEAIAMGIGELSFQDWQVISGAVGVESMYLSVMNLILERRMREGTLSLAGIRGDIERSRLHPEDKDRASLRLDFLERFVADHACLTSLVRPGRLIIVDLRDPTIVPAAAFRLIVVLMRLFGLARLPGGGICPRLLTLDEFHVYAQDDFLVAELDRAVRMMRHQAVTTIFACQDPCQIKPEILELSTLWGMCQTTSPRHTAHLARYNDAMREVTTAQLKILRPGQGYWWARQCSESALTAAPFLVHFRPSATRPGGVTHTDTSHS
jgi:hypothetical protein